MKSTERQIQKAFWDLLREKPYHKITVKDIVTRCDLNRNTFYYHYRGIDALLEETFAEWADDIILSGNKKALRETLEPLVESFLENRKEILNIYKHMDREIFIRYLDRLCRYIIDSYVRRAAVHIDISEEEIGMVKRLYKCTVVGIILDWLDADMSYDLLGYVIHIHDLFNENGLLTFVNR